MDPRYFCPLRMWSKCPVHYHYPVMTVTQVLSVAAMDECLTDPTATSCTDAYGGTTGLPTILAAKCDQSTCTTLQTGVTALSKLHLVCLCPHL